MKARRSQAQLGRTLEITQGRYSKVMSGKVPLTDDLRQKMEAWLEMQKDFAAAPQVTRRVQELEASIRRECMRECMELMQLVSLAGDSGESGS